MVNIEEFRRKIRQYPITMVLTNTVSSTLYRAFDRETDQHFVLKFYKESIDFDNEIAISKKIFSQGDNAHLLPAIDTFPEEYCLVMPSMRGGNLWNLRIRNNGLTPEQSFAIAAQAGLALQQVHAAGVVHNDVKSANILLADADYSSDCTPLAKLIDFGLSYLEASDDKNSRLLWAAGTKEYWAPEKCVNSRKPSFTSDIYSLGLVVHEMLTNLLLYRKIDFLPGHIIPPHEKIPDKVLTVIRTACEKNPDNRYKSAREMIGDLEKAVYGC